MNLRNQHVQLALGILAVVLFVLGLTQPWNHDAAAAPQGNGNAGVTVIFVDGSAANVGHALKRDAAVDNTPATQPSKPSNMACALQSDGTVALATGTYSAPSDPVTAVSQFNGMGCIWMGPNDAVSADILSAVPIGNASALENAYQAALRYSRGWAHKSPTLGETITELPGHVSAYRVTDMATHGLSVTTVDPDLGLVVRYTAMHDTPGTRSLLERWAA